MRPDLDCTGSLIGCASRTLSLMGVVAFAALVLVAVSFAGDAKRSERYLRAACAAERAINLADDAGAFGEAYWDAAERARAAMDAARVSCGGGGR